MMRGLATTMIVGAVAGFVGANAQTAAVPQPPAIAAISGPDRALVARYCVTCHSDRRRAGGLTLEGRDLARVGGDRYDK